MLPPKENDPGSFILPCSVRRLDFNNVLADLGASISIMPFSMFKCLEIEVQESYEKIVYKCSLIAQETNRGLSPFDEKCDGGSLCHNEIKCYWESKRIEVEWENLSLNDWLRIRFGEVSEITRDKILRDHWRKRFENEYDDNKEFEDPDGCGESKENEIRGTVLNKLHDE
ncbi:hypothetical protein Tco_0888475 [Tanacetum coccineum]